MMSTLAEPGFLIDLATAGDYADEMLAATSELPGLVFGSLIAYLPSTLEATLADCLEVAQIVMQRPEVRNPKLENYVRALEGSPSGRPSGRPAGFAHDRLSRGAATVSPAAVPANDVECLVQGHPPLGGQHACREMQRVAP